MIYLIDDNKQNQQQQYGCGFIETGEYKEYLSYLKGVATHERGNFIAELPDKAKAVFFHSTSKDIDADGNFLEKTGTIIKIKKNIDEHKIPYVAFSWGHTSHIASFSGNNVGSMNKRLFYLNLKEYLEDYISTGISDFKILTDGIGYKKEILIQEGLKLIDYLSEKSERIQLNNDENDLIKIKSFFLNAHSLFNLDKYLAEKTISDCELIRIIENSLQSIEKYGKDLYHK